MLSIVSMSKSKSTVLDKEMWKLVKRNRNLSVAWYLMASYAYYELDQPLLSDAAFDELAKFMLERWKAIRHWHKDLITEDDLKAGTLLRRDFPEIVKDATISLLNRKKR